MKVQNWLAEGNYRADADRVLQRVLDAPEHVGELMQIVLEGSDAAQVNRASMVVGNLGRIQPGWLTPYLDAMLEALDQPRFPSVGRNLLRYLSELPSDAIPERLHGKLVDLALRITDDPEAAVANRVFAMQVVANFCDLYPDLAGELRACLTHHIPNGSPGFRSRGRKILSSLPE